MLSIYHIGTYAFIFHRCNAGFFVISISYLYVYFLCLTGWSALLSSFITSLIVIYSTKHHHYLIGLATHHSQKNLIQVIQNLNIVILRKNLNINLVYSRGYMLYRITERVQELYSTGDRHNISVFFSSFPSYSLAWERARSQ